MKIWNNKVNCYINECMLLCTKFVFSSLLDALSVTIMQSMWYHLWHASHWINPQLPTTVLRHTPRMLSFSWCLTTVPTCREVEGNRVRRSFVELMLLLCMLARVDSPSPPDNDWLICLRQNSLHRYSKYAFAFSVYLCWVIGSFLVPFYTSNNRRRLVR